MSEVASLDFKRLTSDVQPPELGRIDSAAESSAKSLVWGIFFLIFFIYVFFLEQPQKVNINVSANTVPYLEKSPLASSNFSK